MTPSPLPALFLLCLLSAGSLACRAQGTVVAPGPGFTLAVAGQPFFPLGWNGLGTCTADADPRRANRGDVLDHLRTMRAHGTNTILEPARADGRIVARATRQGYNWLNYRFKGPGDYTAGHPRPGAYVEGLRWLMDHAFGDDPDRPVYLAASVFDFIRPGYAAIGDHPGADDRLTCAAYRDLIDAERRQYDRDAAARIPPVLCPSPQERRPFWEWNLRYVVQSLRDHPGLLGWYLWDEPEGPAYRHVFGIHEDQPPPAYTGPASLPTPDLLRYAYQLVRQFEEEGKPRGYQRHPIIVDVSSPNVFFSRRFGWSSEGALDPIWSSGPFDRAPGGAYNTPADVLGLEASAMFVHTAGRGDVERHPWYWDQNHLSRHAEMLDDVVRRDSLWASAVVAGQAQLPSHGAYAPAEPLRCEPNDEPRARLLNDRDLVWQLLTPLINGQRGYLFYSHSLMPTTGPGAEQVRRSNRLLEQFQGAGLDRTFLAPTRGAAQVEKIFVRVLTDYYRSDPAFVGPALTHNPGRSSRDERRLVGPGGYTVKRFGRAADERHYGQPQADAYAVTHIEHQLLRTALHHQDGRDYLFLSNAYDARLVVTVMVEAPAPGAAPRIAEGLFDLTPGGAFHWRGTPLPRLSFTQEPGGRRTELTIALEPYEARTFRLAYDD